MSSSDKQGPVEAELDQLAFRFFKLFARYESTLKERGYFSSGKGGHILVDWNRFANDVVGPTFAQDLGNSAAAAMHILENPPKRQAVNDQNQIIWADVSANDKSVQALFGHIQRMRNNLYHGAKFNGTWFDPQRSWDLLRNGLVILTHYEKWL